ncbi:DUF6088 family protein [Bacteroides sp.]
MVITREVQRLVENFQPDYVFTYQDLNLPTERSESVIKMLNRLVSEGVIAKISKGRFYKPKQSVFGALKPKQEEIVKDLLEKDGEIIGYMTGYSVFNRLGLTTQVPNIIQIGTNVRKNKKKRGMFTISFVLQLNPITKENITLLQLLDAIRFIKEIPDATINQSCKRILAIIRELDKEETEKVLMLAEKYPPMVRAILGAMVENIYGTDKAVPLWNTLNPLTTYKIGIGEQVLPQIKRWRIE